MNGIINAHQKRHKNNCTTKTWTQEKLYQKFLVVLKNFYYKHEYDLIIIKKEKEINKLDDWSIFTMF
jgi:hypothetical protein